MTMNMVTVIGLLILLNTCQKLIRKIKVTIIMQNNQHDVRDDNQKN